MADKPKKPSTLPLDWKKVYYMNCPLVSTSNIDQELSWIREEFTPQLDVQWRRYDSNHGWLSVRGRRGRKG